MNLDYMIIEDEFFSFERLRNMIGELRPSWCLACHTESVAESTAYLREHRPGLIFMDIELADHNCFEIFALTDVLSPVIFITAYNEYAIRAFKVNSVDYLLKPLEQCELVGALNKFDRISTSATPDYGALLNIISSGASIRERIAASIGDNFISIEICEVAYFVSEDKYTSLRTFSGQTYIIDDSLNGLEPQLDRKQFFRASRNHIINIKSIRQVRKHFNGRLKLNLCASHNSAVPPDIIISAARRNEFLRWFGGEIV